MHFKVLDEITAQQFLQDECRELRIAILVGHGDDIASFGRCDLQPCNNGAGSGFFGWGPKPFRADCISDLDSEIPTRQNLDFRIDHAIGRFRLIRTRRIVD